ncbi:MAG TPA: hypothetical protein VJ844_07095 [Mucilaginibacter sp.]|nr:hypothetical protein [Mucilaginibacter sp.]
MDQYLDNRQNEILWKLLANPADNGYAYSSDLRQLASDFPQSGLLQALYARSDRGNMGHAASSFNPKTLYVLMNAYDNLAEVSEGQIIQELNGAAYGGTADVQREEAVAGIDHDDVLEAELENKEVHTEAQVIIAEDERDEIRTISDRFETEKDEKETEETLSVEEPAVVTENEDVHHLVTEIPEEDERTETPGAAFEEEIIEFHEPAILDNADTAEHLAELPEEEHIPDTLEPVIEDEVIEFHEIDEEPVSEIEEAPKIETVQEATVGEIQADDTNEEQSLVEQEIVAQSHPSEGIEDDVYDEITGIENIRFTPQASRPVEEVAEPELIAAANENVSETVDEPGYEELIPESLAGSDYFVFERSEQITQQPEPEESRVEEEPTVAVPANEFKAPEADTTYVSKYHDEKMPYTFMWWLDKTRKEHAGIYQPFKLDTTQAIKHTGDETLQQQYYENIFHVSTVEELDQSATGQGVEFDMQSKEDRIIKKFIAEAPHISTPTSDKLDNENKAKKSAEDQDELVTETLANIYVDQMLYHKAINTYKKLILKFPEKSRYFADQIELLERKIN